MYTNTVIVNFYHKINNPKVNGTFFKCGSAESINAKRVPGGILPGTVLTLPFG